MSYSRSSSYHYQYQYQYHYSYSSSSGNVEKRSVSLPNDCFDRFMAYTPRRTIGQDDFMKVTQVIMEGPDATDADIHQAFSIFDSDGSGKLDVSELSKVIPAILPGTTLNSLNTMIQRYDKNCDNQLSLAEFTRLIKGGIGRDLAFQDFI